MTLNEVVLVVHPHHYLCTLKSQ